MLRRVSLAASLLLAVLAVFVIASAQSDPRCEGFQRLTGGELFISTYSWSTVPDIDEYKLNFYGSEGQFVTSYWILPPYTKFDVNLGDLPTGAYFQWEVEALENGGQKVCNTGRSPMTRLPNDRPAPASSGGGESPVSTQPPPGPPSEGTEDPGEGTDEPGATEPPPVVTQEPPGPPTASFTPSLTFTPTISNTPTPQGSTTPEGQ
jgi:hypothetical protein